MGNYAAEWNPKLYDEKHAFVSHYGSHVMKLLAPKDGEIILDLGCGTGDLTHQISEAGAIVTGIDQSASMIEQARKKYPSIFFQVEDVLHMQYEQQFDAVFSNAVLHWIQHPKQALQNIYRSLKHGGRFVAEFGGKGNVNSITNELEQQLKQLGSSSPALSWYFPSIGEYTNLMEATGFKVTFAQLFDRPTLLDGERGIRNWLEMFCNNILQDIMDEVKEVIYTKMEQNLKAILIKNGKWYADYKRIRVIGIKE
ncbi:class I SAM-dependent methyltransferase [Heyndrickxia ginsengihumi]|uniref:class I SAM-dependent methyltransferase n=1 Tax=Heyndrickxia ginsengihumi TaxID=363870 RepID=UPI001D463650|nr:class I SAM-dependent methyltransferase [Heyndrickxia ginsengihumi]MBE6183357.1 class I SAM-dependent methyltransferase [Bacillus sp. (in: firmicutes)]MCM3024081.1 methyltransferase domain-containing protein [Heyndrickxia ginsengihumi]